MKMKKNCRALWIYVILMLIVCARFSAVLPGDDFSFHAQRVDAIAQEFANGYFFPIRIYHSTLEGMGYSSPLFYGDLFLYPAAFLVTLNCVDAITATQITMWLILLGSGLSFYYFLRVLGIRAEAALPSAILYVFSPYCLTDCFVRAAIGESLCLVFLPLVISSSYRLLLGDTRLKQVLTLSLSMAAMLLSHLITTAITLVLLALFVCGYYLRELYLTHTMNKKSLLGFVYAACICAGITAWFYLPLMEQLLIGGQLKAFSGSEINPETRAISPSMLFLAADGRNVMHGFLRKVFHVDVTVRHDTVGAFIYPLIGVIIVLITDRKNVQHKNTILALVGFSVILLGIMSARPFWRIKLLNPIQFPWRLLVFYTIAVCIAAGILLNQEHLSAKSRRMIWIGFLCANLIYSLPILYKTRNVVDQVHTYNTCSIGREDYLDKYTSVKSLLKRKDRVGSDNPDGEYTMEKHFDSLRLEYSNSQGETVELPLTYVYGYYAQDPDSGWEYEVTRSPVGLVQLWLPENSSGSILVRYAGTTIQRISEYISAVCFVLLLICLIFAAVRKSPAQSGKPPASAVHWNPYTGGHRRRR